MLKRSGFFIEPVIVLLHYFVIEFRLINILSKGLLWRGAEVYLTYGYYTSLSS